MLYYLFEWLHKLNFPGAGMFGYTSFRALMAVILALLISSIWGDKFINLLKKKQITETQRDAKTDPFGVNKVGVPSMGGVIIIVAILIPCLLLGKLDNIYMILMLITTVWLGSLGFADDYIKIFKKDKEGLHGKFKIIGQVGLGLIVGLTLYLSPDVVIRENIEVHTPGQEMEVIHGTNDLKSTQTTIPFFKSNNLDYADLVGFMGEHAQTAGWFLFVIITIFVVTAVSNGANLNDGMDGMAAGNSAIIGATLGILAYVSSHIEFASYLNIMYIPGSEELVIYICAFIGALIGFLWYNAYPAQVFMGDTGSLTIGGIIAVFAIIIHKELLIPILCGVFLVENLSVILQRFYYKIGKRKGVKQRLFKRTPIHDHFRTSMSLVEPGCTVKFTKPDQLFHESKITVRFWIVTTDGERIYFTSTTGTYPYVLQADCYDPKTEQVTSLGTNLSSNACNMEIAAINGKIIIGYRDLTANSIPKIAVFDGENWSDTALSDQSCGAVSVLADEDGVWIAPSGGKNPIYFWEDGTIISYPLSESLVDRAFQIIPVLSNGTFYIAVDAQNPEVFELYQLQKQTKTWELTGNSIAQELVNQSVLAAKNEKLYCLYTSSDQKVFLKTLQLSHATDIIVGDLNENGTLDLADVVLLQQHLLQQTTLTAEQLQRADGIADQFVNGMDLAWLKRKLLG